MYTNIKKLLKNAYDIRDISMQCGQKIEKQYELITNQFSKTVDEIMSFLIDNEYKFICFHLTRVFPYEVEGILNNGLISHAKQR